MRFIYLAGITALGIASTVALSQSVPADKPVPPQSTDTAANGGHYNTKSTDMGTLLGDPEAKAVLSKYIPDIVNNPGITQAAAMTLKQLQQYAPDMLTDAVLANIDEDLGKLPVKK